VTQRATASAFGRAILTSLSLAIATPSAVAHQGAPYPMLHEVKAAGCSLSAWVDPDEGLGDLFFTVACPTEGAATAAGVMAADVHVQVRVREGEESPEAVAASDRPWTGELLSAAPGDKPNSYVLQVPFSHKGPWDVQVVVSRQDAEPTTLTSRVNVEDPGPPSWQAAFFAVPFVLVGVLWCLSLLARRRSRRLVEAHA
jgi:hypothetical protein